MFDTLRHSRPTPFDRFTQGLLAGLALAFAVSVVFLLVGIANDGVAPALAQGPVSSTVVSVQALLPDLGGSLLSLPAFRL